nr:hypothetical protein Iba_chr06eCG6830 [Ipomoea batatas]
MTEALNAKRQLVLNTENGLTPLHLNTAGSIEVSLVETTETSSEDCDAGKTAME